MQNTYGVLDNNGIHTDVSNTEQGAKNYATRNGYNKVSIRYNCGYTAELIAEKINNNWIKQ
nr:hypothetical protein [uncultured Flavobacterium sp.]